MIVTAVSVENLRHTQNIINPSNKERKQIKKISNLYFNYSPKITSYDGINKTIYIYIPKMKDN